ncbi:MAG: hypothetical protein AB1555_15700 [Nitrospirota bacterium]
MGLLKDKDKDKDKDKHALRKTFDELAHEVKLVMFTQEVECESCRLVHDLLAEVGALSKRLAVEVHDFVAEAALALQYRVDKIPATIVMGNRDYGIRLYGVPGGYELPR